MTETKALTYFCAIILAVALVLSCATMVRASEPRTSQAVQLGSLTLEDGLYGVVVQSGQAYLVRYRNIGSLMTLQDEHQKPTEIIHFPLSMSDMPSQVISLVNAAHARP
jgi:hypothetical protein